MYIDMHVCMYVCMSVSSTSAVCIFRNNGISYFFRYALCKPAVVVVPEEGKATAAVPEPPEEEAASRDIALTNLGLDHSGRELG